jgi:hypothetical protein
VKNKKQEGIVTSTMLRAQDILDSDVLLCPNGEDNAYVASINHTPKVWTIHVPSFEWPQCDCPLAKQGIACKHVMKVFKMLHPNIPDGAIVRDTGTFHGVNKCLPATRPMVCDDLPDQQLNIDPNNEDIGILEMTTTIAQVKYADLGELIDQVFNDIKSIANEIPAL